MNTEKWNNLNKELDKIYIEIFKAVNMSDLDIYTKRKMIFEYLCNSTKYDYDLLNEIKKNKLDHNYKIKRDSYAEILSVLELNKGICNGIAQAYKLLLEKVGIFSLCVICDDLTPIKHQLNLVYDFNSDTFSFDDITSVIVCRGNMDDFFDYDIEDAYKYNQGCRPIYQDKYWSCLPTTYIYSLIGKNKLENFKYLDQSNIFQLPKNIKSQKKITKKL